MDSKKVSRAREIIGAELARREDNIRRMKEEIADYCASKDANELDVYHIQKLCSEIVEELHGREAVLAQKQVMLFLGN